MTVYWESVFAFNFLVDYLLLFGAARLAGRSVARLRLLAGAALGGVYAAVQLLLPRSAILLLLALALVGAAAYGGSGRMLKLTLLFFLCACALAGTALVIGQCFGSVERLARGVICAALPWGVFLLAGGTAYVLLSIVFRYGAAHTGGETVQAVIGYRGRSARVRLLRDTGNTLADPLTGQGVPVIDVHALGDLVGVEELASLPRIAYCSVGCADGSLPALRCDTFTLDGRALGARLIALADRPIGGSACAGLWCEGCGKEEEYASKTLA